MLDEVKEPQAAVTSTVAEGAAGVVETSSPQPVGSQTVPPRTTTVDPPGAPATGAPPAGAGIRFDGKSCFVIMPYGRSGEKRGDGADEREHFDRVYKLITEAITELKLRPLRSDKERHSAPIHSKMISDILDADLAIVDISGDNANVFYELGIRHTARPSGTVLIGGPNAKPPFNIAGVRIIHYDLAQYDKSKQELKQAIIANLGSRVNDSLVHALVPGLNLSRRPVPLKERVVRKTTLEVQDEKVTRTFEMGIITGDIVSIDMVDVWVNPESTRMDMARIYDDSVSAFIRYHGARKDKLGNVEDDLIYDALRKYFRREATIVEAGNVLVTGPGELSRQNVRRIFHVAAQHGEPCNGSQTIRAYSICVTNALEKMDQLNSRWCSHPGTCFRPLRSIVFPLMGTQNRDRDSFDVAENLVRAARNYLTHWPSKTIREVYFLAYTQRDLELCEAAFARIGLKSPVATS